MTEAWAWLKDFGIILNYLLIPIGVGVWKIGGYVIKMEKRVTYLELLHKIKGCAEGLNHFDFHGGD